MMRNGATFDGYALGELLIFRFGKAWGVDNLRCTTVHRCSVSLFSVRSPKTRWQ